ncbi:MAG: hypothetical protein H0Z40_06390 [Desulfotomaculum sp.]|nr:hypothetical protein [Desulfotomaculum sp.]
MYLNTLHEIALSMMNRLSLDDLFKDIVKRACQLLGTKHGFICLVKPDSNIMEAKVGVGIYANYIGVSGNKRRRAS